MHFKCELHCLIHFLRILIFLMQFVFQGAHVLSNLILNNFGINLSS